MAVARGRLGKCLKWLPHCWKASTSSHIRAADGFQRRGRSCSWFALGVGGNWAQLGQSGRVTTTPTTHKCQTSSHCWPSRGFNTSRTTFDPRHALFSTVLPQTPFYHGCTGTSGLTAAATCFWKGGRWGGCRPTKLGSMICPFVSCISCTASCDVTH